ncbi:MAG: ABC transporter ATP-binding protein [Chloroflexales bacterium]|nr:ABC transporter ATP-binding protein [Chloroflexales bacterium]
MLEVTDLAVNYGHVQALQGVTLEIRQGEIVALIGANGAGKTTTLMAISGLVRPAAGRITFKGADITRAEPYDVVRMGLAHVPQGRQIFADQTVEDNLRLGAYTRGRNGRPVEQLMAREFERFPILGQRRGQLAGTLSGGEQQMLAISRGLMIDPPFIALDEPSLGLAPLIVQGIARTIRALNQAGTTILLIEQMATMALALAHRAYVLQTGQVVLEGTGKDLLAHPEVAKAYLGG